MLQQTMATIESLASKIEGEVVAKFGRRRRGLDEENGRQTFGEKHRKGFMSS